MADNYTELRESHFYSRCDVTEARPAPLMGRMAGWTPTAHNPLLGVITAAGFVIM